MTRRGLNAGDVRPSSRRRGGGPQIAAQPRYMPFSAAPIATSRVLVIGGDLALREFCRDRLAWLGCAVHFARDITDVITNGFAADVMMADLPTGVHTAATLRHLTEYAEAVGSALIALTDDLTLIAGPPALSPVQVLPRPCTPDALCHAITIARTSRARRACRS